MKNRSIFYSLAMIFFTSIPSNMLAPKVPISLETTAAIAAASFIGSTKMGRDCAHSGWLSKTSKSIQIIAPMAATGIGIFGCIKTFQSEEPDIAKISAYTSLIGFGIGTLDAPIKTAPSTNTTAPTITLDNSN